MKTSVLFNKLGSYPLSFNMGEMLKLPSKWIAGFSAGEISFNLTLENKSSYKLGLRPRVSISLPQDKRDLSILISIQNHLGCGFIRTRSLNIPGRLPVCEFQVNAFKDILNVVLPFFNANPLLTRISKRLNYLDLEAIMRLVERKEHLSQSGLDQIRTIIAKMNRKREYPEFPLGA
jgi:hypothetical protein